MSSTRVVTFANLRFAVLLPGMLGIFLTSENGTAVLRAEEIPATVVDVIIEGNETIPASVILQKITTQPGRPISNRQVREAKRSLMNTRWFYSVTERFEESPKGSVLIFKVHERPIVRRVHFYGLKKIKKKELVSWTGLKVGSPFDVVANRESVQRIRQEYKERGYQFVEVRLEKGGDPNDREVIFRIKEGPKVRVTDRAFQFVTKSGKLANSQLPFLQRPSQDGTYGLSPSASRLKTKLQTKESWFGLFGGTYKPETIQQDVESLKQYYLGLGFFDIQVDAKPRFTPDKSGVQVLYTINEGVPYKVRDIKVVGNYVIPTSNLRKEAQLQKGQYFNSLPLGKDVRSMLEQYGQRGHYFASVIPVWQFTEEAGIVDIVFEIDEDRPRFVRNINVHLRGEHPYTQQTVPINQLQIEPGDLANPAMINRGRSRTAGAGILENVQVNVIPVDPGQSMMASQSRTIRGQSGAGYTPSWKSLLENPAGSNDVFSYGHAFPHDEKTEPPTADEVPEKSAPKSAPPAPAVSLINTTERSAVLNYSACKPSSIFYQPQKSLLVSSFPEGVNDKEPVVRGQSPGGQYYGQPGPGRGNAVLEGSPFNNQFQALPPGWVDINVAANEGRTGRLMFGAGVNSDAGIVGSFVWDERNFNLFRPPTSFADIIDGRAWRGGGQRFRLEAAPGDQVSRYVLSWTDPYFLYTDYSLGLSGFYFNRFYPDWDETRTGGRITLSKQLDPEWSVSGALRLEDVEVNSPRIVSGTTRSVPQLEAVRGHNDFFSFRASLTHDTRDSAMMPTEGHFIDGAYELAFGDFEYPRFEGEFRQYFTMHNRPDGSGRHVLTLAANLGWSGPDTPIFEKYFAGGFQSFRGFAFRGVTPRGADNISLGGRMQMLGTAEYRVPVTADDMINLVVFSDLGTVETNGSTIDNFRVTVGVGLRLIVPAMGPVPLAFDFGFPVKSARFDDERVFSFYVGINR